MEQFGIIDVDISEVAEGNPYQTIESPARSETYNGYGGLELLQETVDLVMYCQPPGSYRQIGSDKVDWIAYAFVNGFETFYSDEWCGYVSTQVHEVGHNLNLGHSGLPGGSEYEDASDMMGFSYRLDDGPDICFNAAKSFQLQWYEDKVGSVDPRLIPGGFRSYDLIGVADYGTADGLVSLRLEYQGTQTDGVEWYVGYNRVSGINSGVPNVDEAAPNKVHLIEKVNEFGGSYQYGLSERIAALAAGEEHSWNVGGTEVTLRVDSIDGAIASVTLIGGNAPLVPTGSPTVEPLTESPTALAPGECVSDGKIGLTFVLTVQLDDKSGAEFAWLLLNDNDGSGFEGNSNNAFTPNAVLRYTLCLLKLECYTLTLTDSGGDGICCDNGDGFYRGTIDDTEIFAGGEFAGTEERRFCIGREPCEETTGQFKYKIEKKRGRKNTTCALVSKARGRTKNKICKASVGRSRRKKVQQVCMETCGNIGLGACQFLDEYGDPTSAPSSSPLSLLTQPGATVIESAADSVIEV
eukprot:CAMPEP_0197179308 /NCGR_PEP_ID=MMETSP1423-20130617/4309_1 /TAXON_ID=476441 /ORGANISM="Pseudo-nitzschia heimii, Strain UNC1101" /LENGTH=522 /DNA_ID=CAMNT_0042629205 /DNA_START=39 /DNA_END=1607 /DNA_ORIENTATION=+